MIFSSAKDNCKNSIIKLLKNKEHTYAQLFKKIKVSHTTLQESLKELIKHSMIKKIPEENKYILTQKGKKLSVLLRKMKEIIQSE